jgi:hypothetical protein
MERTAGLEPAFSAPIGVHRFVAGVGYLRALGATRMSTRSSSLKAKCPGVRGGQVNRLPDQDSNLD